MPIGLRSGMGFVPLQAALLRYVFSYQDTGACVQPEQAHREQGEQNSAVDDVAESLHVRVEVSSSMFEHE